ncbi:MAG: TonB-dependent receptor [Candidatus Coatesbacteria bacterium]|nr:MAG: TonB-dependent receptor [Candidatus Coatesbacteria bacterium]
MKNALVKIGILVTLTVLASATAAVAEEPAAGELRLKVVGNDGAPLQGVEVSASAVHAETVTAFTDAAGEVTLLGLTPGVYTVHAELPGYFSQKRMGVLVRSGQTPDVNFTLKRMFPPLRIQVTADRIEETARFTPASTGAVEADEITSRGVRTFDQAIESISGVQVNRTSPITTSSISIRGSSESQGGGTGNRVLLLLDGRPAMNPDVGSANWTLIPVGIVERVEVVKGATSPLYGTTAMGGVINVITVKPGDKTVAGISTEAGFYEKPPAWMRWTGKRIYFNTLQGHIAKKMGKIGISAHVSRQMDEGYKENNDSEFYTGFGKFSYSPAGNADEERYATVEISGSGGKSENGRPHSWESPLRPLSIEPEDANDRQYKTWGDIDIAAELPLTGRVTSKGHLYYHRNETRTAYNPDGRESDPQPEGFETKSVSEQAGVILQAEHLWGGRQRFLGGAEGSLEWVDGRPENLSYGRHRAGSTAVFIMSETYLPFRTTLTGALRYDYKKVLGTYVEDQISPRVGLLIRPTDGTAIRTSYAAAFRAPTFAEMFLKEVPSGHIFRPNPDLGAEHLRAFEVGINQGISERLNVDVAYFHHKYYDMISWDHFFVGGESILTPYNRDVAVIQGIDFNAYAELFWDISVKGGYTYLNAKDRTPGAANETLPYKPEHQLYFAGDWLLLRKLLLHCDIRYRSKIEEVVLYPESPPGAYTLVNGKATYRLPKGFSVNFAVNNIGNEQYEEMAKYRMPGRSYAFGFGWDLQ